MAAILYLLIVLNKNQRKPARALAESKKNNIDTKTFHICFLGIFLDIFNKSCFYGGHLGFTHFAQYWPTELFSLNSFHPKPLHSHQKLWGEFILNDLRTFFKKMLFMAAILDLLIMLKIEKPKPVLCILWPPKPKYRHQKRQFLLIRGVFRTFPKKGLFMAAILDFLKMLNR